MKTNEEILNNYYGSIVRGSPKGMTYSYEQDDILKAMKEAQKEIVEHILEKVAKTALVVLVPHDEEEWEGQKEITRRDILDFYMDDEDDEWAYEQFKERDGFTIEVDRETILSLKDQIIKEIENGTIQ